MSPIAIILGVGIILGFLVEKMYRMFALATGVYVGFAAYLNLGWNGWVSVVVAIVTYYFVAFVCYAKGAR